MADRTKAVAYLLEYYKDVGIDGSEAKARYTLGYRDYQTLEQALADMKSGATEKALTETAQVFVAGGAYDKVPDLKSAVAAGLPILEAAKRLRKEPERRAPGCTAPGALAQSIVHASQTRLRDNFERVRDVSEMCITRGEQES